MNSLRSTMTGVKIMSNPNISPNSSSGSPHETPLNFLLVGGAWFDTTYLQPMAIELIRMGHKVVTQAIDGSDLKKNFDDDAQAVLAAMGEADNLALVTHSRGVEPGPRALAELDKRGELSRVKCLVVLNSAGPHGVELPADVLSSLKNPNRYTADYQAGIVPITQHVSEYKPEAAEDVIAFNIKDEGLKELVVSSMHKQKSADISASALPAMPKSVPVVIIQGALDRVINLEKANAINKHYFGEDSKVIPTASHLWPAEQPEQAAKICAREAVKASV